MPGGWAPEDSVVVVSQEVDYQAHREWVVDCRTPAGFPAPINFRMLVDLVARIYRVLTSARADCLTLSQGMA